jgi:uncharacterized protein with von Willebrand factor type A (vWA) domain
VRFARVLRGAGMAVGTDRALRAVAALEVIGAGSGAMTCTPRCLR